MSTGNTLLPRASCILFKTTDHYAASGYLCKTTPPHTAGQHQRPTRAGLCLPHRSFRSVTHACTSQARLTLLLGLPGSGKSLLLKALAGQAKSDKRLRIEGDVMYNDRNIKSMYVQRSAAYIDQVR